MAEEKLCSNSPVMETIEPGEFVEGFVVEITSKIEGRLVVNRYYLEDLGDEYSRMSEEVAEFPIFHKKNRKNIVKFLSSAKKIASNVGEEQIYIDRTAFEELKKCL